MKHIFLISFLIITTISSAQNSNIIDHSDQIVVYLVKENQDTIKITGSIIDDNKDSVLINVDLLKNCKSTHIQSLRMPCSYPLQVSECSFGPQKGILVKYDPAVRYGNSYLFLLNERTNKLSEVEGFVKLGNIEYLTINNHKYSYSYISCGCADNCWKSCLFQIKNNCIDTLAYISCDCNMLLEKSNKSELKTIDNCDKFNNQSKLNSIKEYWTNKIINGL